VAGRKRTAQRLEEPTTKLLDSRTTQAIANTLIPLEKRISDKRQFANEKRRLFTIAKNCDLFNTKAVTEFIETLKTYDPTTKQRNGKPTSSGYKKCLFQTYSTFCKDNQMPFDRPKLKCQYPVPLIPTTANVEKIINNASQKYATIFKILSDTAVEGAELRRTHRNMIDAEQGTISIIGCKGHTNKVYKLKAPIAELLRLYLAKHQEPYPFPDSRAVSTAWQYYRKQTAKKLLEPQLMKIPLKSLRNYSGAIFYNTKGKDPWATMRHMRHRRLETTQHYLQSIVTTEAEEYTHLTIQLGTPTTIKEIEIAIDEGYQYVTDADGYKLFHKRK
jgi:integrase